MWDASNTGFERSGGSCVYGIPRATSVKDETQGLTASNLEALAGVKEFESCLKYSFRETI